MIIQSKNGKLLQFTFYYKLAKYWSYQGKFS